LPRERGSEGDKVEKEGEGAGGKVSYQVLTGLEKETKLMLTTQKPEDEQGG
jgi:hypothetical protein